MNSKLTFCNLLAVCLVLSSCGHLKNKESQVERQNPFVASSDVMPNKVVVTDEDLDEDGEAIGPSVDEELAKHRIIGSAAISKDGSYDGKTYYLYGAEHLNLQNYYFDIPVVYNDAVKKWINYFLDKGRGFFERYSARAGRYAPMMGKILEEHGLPRDLIFLAMAESGFQNKAKSYAAAVGPWQFMKYTGRTYGLKSNWYIDERYDPIKATIAASRYLKKLYGEFGEWELAAAAYNAGEGKVGRAIARYSTENFWDLSKGKYLKAETKNYVPKIMALAIIGKNLQNFGFDDIDFHEPLDFEEITVPGGTDLVLLSEKMGLDFEEIQALNPEVLRWFIPGHMKSYDLRLPIGYKAKYADCCEKDNLQAVAFQSVRVGKKGASINAIAAKFKVKPYVLEELNNLSASERLSKGAEVILPFRIGQNPKAPMYADLYELPRKHIYKKRSLKAQLDHGKKKGKRIVKISQTYTVKKGDTLWTVAKKTGISVDNLINSNLSLINSRGIKTGDKLVVRE